MNEEQKIEHILRRMQADRSVDAPADAILYAKNLFRTRSAEPNRSFIRRMAAVLTADLAPGTLAFGERSATSGQARQMLFESGENAIDVRIVDRGVFVDLRGQVLGPAFENAEVELKSGETHLVNRTDELGSFAFAAVPRGECTLSIRSGESEIFIESLII